MNNKYIVFLLSLILIISIHYVLVFLLESPTSNNSKPVENNSSNIEENKHIPFVEKFEEPVDNSELLLRWLSKEGDSIYASVMNDKDQTIEKMTSPIAEDINNTTQLTSWAGNISYSPAFF